MQLSASFHSLSHVFTMLARPLIDIHLAISSTSALGFSSKNSSREGDNLPLSNGRGKPFRSEEHTSELQSLMRISYAVFCLNKTKTNYNQQPLSHNTINIK